MAVTLSTSALTSDGKLNQAFSDGSTNVLVPNQALESGGNLATLAGAVTASKVQTELKSYTAPVTGEMAGSTSAAQMTSVPGRLARIKANFGNAGRVYVGVSGVTKAAGTTTATAGLELSAGEDTGWLPVDNLNRLFYICTNAADAFTYMVLA